MNKESRYSLPFFVLFLLLFAVSLYSDIPENVSPYVQLGHVVKVSIYKNATVDAKTKKIIALGELIKESNNEVPVGSGTIISSDGLILTNYHVYDIENTFRYDSRINRLYLRQRVSTSMLVYKLADNDPLKPPVMKYLAVPVGLDKKHDTALLKIHAEIKGKQIEIKDLPFARFGNPFEIQLNETLLILGYPAKGGDTITITQGKFLGYYRNRLAHILDGFIKTDAAMSPGNSGGAALYKQRLVGVPTGVTFPDQAGSDMGYIHPVTWAAKVLTIASQKFKFNVQEIPTEWMISDYNTDETRKNIYTTGHIISSHNMGPLKAEVLITRTDRTLEQIQDLHLKLQRIIRIQLIHQMNEQGITTEEIASRLNIKAEEVNQALSTDVSKMTADPDIQAFTRREFYYAVTLCDDRGFFILDVPRNQKVKLYAFADNHRTMVRNFTSKEGISQNLGKIIVFKY